MQWSLATSKENDFSHFEIEESSNGEDFIKVVDGDTKEAATKSIVLR